MLYKNHFNAIMTTSSLAQVAKLVDAGDSKSPAERCVGSSPTLGTTLKKNSLSRLFFYVYYCPPTSTKKPTNQGF